MTEPQTAEQKVVNKPLSEQDELRLLRLQQRQLVSGGRSWLFHCTKPGTYQVTAFIGPDGQIGLRFDDETI